MSTSHKSTELTEELPGTPKILLMEEGAGEGGEKLILTSNLLLLNEHSELLLGRRALDDEYQPGRWNLPGGVRDPHESFVAAASREVTEEFGLQLQPDTFQFFRWYRCIYTDRVVEAVCYLARIEGRPPLTVCEREFSEGGFFPIAEAAAWELAFRQEVILQDLLMSSDVPSYLAPTS